MKAVGIEELKSHLSEYLRLTKAGETILVTERDDIIAELRPARRQAAAPTDFAGILDELAAEGVVTRAGQTRTEWSWAAKGLGLPRGSAGTLLDELRRER